jgi:hypothetical protein
LIGVLIEVILEFKDRELYDSVSLQFIKYDVFPPLVKTIVSSSIE